MRNIALKLMYNGTAYHGWQVQKNAVTVCETLQKALEKITGAPVHLTGCGRTDAGVHAERYIANFRTESRIPLERLPFAINTHTPEDIAVSEALEVAEDFNAIGSCLKKEYTYRIYNSRVKNPFYVNRAYFYPKRLDEEFLNRAAHQFVGTHDFAAVRSVGTETRTTVRTVYWCDVTRSGELLELKVNPEAVDPEDVEMLQDMIIAAVNQAMRTADSEASANMSKLTGGLNLGGLF